MRLLKVAMRSKFLESTLLLIRCLMTGMLMIPPVKCHFPAFLPRQVPFSLLGWRISQKKSNRPSMLSSCYLSGTRYFNETLELLLLFLSHIPPPVPMLFPTRSYLLFPHFTVAELRASGGNLLPTLDLSLPPTLSPRPCSAHTGSKEAFDQVGLALSALLYQLALLNVCP